MLPLSLLPFPCHYLINPYRSSHSAIPHDLTKRMMSSNRSQPIVIDSDSEDEAELERVRERAKRLKSVGKGVSSSSSANPSTRTTALFGTPDSSTSQQPAASTSSSSTRIDFKALNAERQARQAQRQMEETKTTTMGSKEALQRISPDKRFWEGTVKRGFNKFSKDGVPLHDFIRPTTNKNAAGLTHAFVSSYVWDLPWLQTILPTAACSTPPPQVTFLMVEGLGNQFVSATNAFVTRRVRPVGLNAARFSASLPFRHLAFMNFKSLAGSPWWLPLLDVNMSHNI